jgi:UDP-glucose 4-epimerase
MGCYERMKEIAGVHKAEQMKFLKADLRNADDLDRALGSAKFDAVIHFAGRKAVGESVAEPMLYYTHNLVGTVNLIQAMRKHRVRRIVFSSSCTVYGEPAYTPLDEDHARAALSPYGRTKLVIEDIFQDVSGSEDGWRVVLLRYFNPVGAHKSGHIGEHPVGVPNNLMPYIQQVATGSRPTLNVFGADYPTRDGTCIRDYIHVSDVAVRHPCDFKPDNPTLSFSRRRRKHD